MGEEKRREGQRAEGGVRRERKAERPDGALAGFEAVEGRSQGMQAACRC